MEKQHNLPVLGTCFSIMCVHTNTHTHTHTHTHTPREGEGGYIAGEVSFLFRWELPCCLALFASLSSPQKAALFHLQISHPYTPLFPTETKGEEPGSVFLSLVHITLFRFNWCWRTNCFCGNCLKVLFTDTSLDSHCPSSQQQ